MALGFERATWARRRGRPVGRVRSAPSRRAGSIRPLAGAAARPAAAVVPAAASASASRANWLAFDERPSSQSPACSLKVVLESRERGRFSQSRMLAAARRGASASPHGPGMHPHTLLSRMPMRSVDAVVVLQLCSAATAPVSRVAAVGRAAPASSAARRRGGTRALRSPSEGRRLERWSRASRQTRRRHPYPRPHP